MINIVIPMAGHGSRFQKEGFNIPKPLIEVHGKPMIKVVIDNLRPSQSHRFIFLCLESHVTNYDLRNKLQVWAGHNAEIISINSVTEGAACTVLKAKEYINDENHLMIANCDQWIDFSIDTYLDVLVEKELDGLIMTMQANDPKWSFVRFGSNQEVIEVVEKQVVSQEATVGIYNFRQGNMFVDAAEKMIAKNLRVNNEFYVAPCYNELIEDGKKIGVHNIGRVLDGMYGLGTPGDLKKFTEMPVSRNI